MTLEQLIHEHLTALNLVPEDRTKVKAAQHELNQLLRQKFDPQGEVRLGGSFARGTSIRPLKDVDLLLVLSKQKAPSLLSENPGKRMDSLALELQKLLGTPVRVQNRSLGLTWQGLPFDLVPCAVGGDPKVLRLPDLSRSRWLTTSPAQHQEQLQAADQACKQKLLPLVRGVKAWKRASGSPLRSFHLEAMLWTEMDAPPKTWAEGLQLAFSRLAERVKRPFNDPTGLGAQVDEGLTQPDRDRASAQLAEAARLTISLNNHAAPALVLERLLGPRP